MGLIYILQFFLISGLVEYSWISHICRGIQSVVIEWYLISFNLLWYIVLAEVYKGNLASHIYICSKKRRKCLTAFRGFWIFFINIYQSSTTDNFSNVSYNVESVTFYILYYIKFTAVSYTLNMSFIHTWFCNLMHCSFKILVQPWRGGLVSWFDPWSGHVPRLWVQSLVGAHYRRLLIDVSLSLKQQGRNLG